MAAQPLASDENAYGLRILRIRVPMPIEASTPSIRLKKS
jgi:hypothetical protein